MYQIHVTTSVKHPSFPESHTPRNILERIIDEQLAAVVVLICVTIHDPASF